MFLKKVKRLPAVLMFHPEAVIITFVPDCRMRNEERFLPSIASRPVDLFEIDSGFLIPLSLRGGRG